MTKTTTMETTSCLLCDADDFEPLYILKDYYTQQPGQFYQVRCRQCGLIYLNPRPTVDTIDQYYPPDYECFLLRNGNQLGWLKRHMIEYGLRKRCRPLLKVQKPGKLLDIGCGTGHFMATMTGYQWETVGIDLSTEAIRFAREVFNLEAYAGKIEEFHFAANSFDAVTMWDTLEHMHQPGCILTKVHHLLKPGGYLLIKAPSSDSFEARIFRNYWVGLDAPRHLVVFSAETLTRFLQEAGFDIIRSWSIASSYSTWAISLRFLVNQKPTSKWLKWLYKAFASPWGNLATVPFFQVIDRLLPGPDITILAQKK